MIRKRIVIIDPNNTEEYVYGLIKELSNHYEVIYITKKNSRFVLENVIVKKWFYSNKMHCKLYMGLNYIVSYLRLIVFAIINKIDVIHIQWCKLEKLDFYFIQVLKRICKVVYTAHNVLPHVNGESKMTEYKKLYSAVDKIIVHGKAIKEELIQKFTIESTKIYIQPYGFSMLEKPLKEERDELLKIVSCKKKTYEKIVLSAGLISKYKGTDRLLSIWNEFYAKENFLLVIAGKVIEKSEELDRCLSNKAENVIFVDRLLSDYEFSALCEMSDLIVLPYRNASMSGVVYSAARAKTPILTTKVGTIADYLEKDIDSFVIENTDEELKNGLKNALRKSNNELLVMGNKLHDNFEKKYDWTSIVFRLIEECY